MLGILSAGVGMTVSPGKQHREAQLEAAQFCPSVGVVDPAISESVSISINPGTGCLSDITTELDTQREAEPRLTVIQDSSNGSVTIVGDGYEFDADVEVNLRIISNGVMGGPFSVSTFTNSTGSFATDVLQLSCPEPNPILYVTGEDGLGNVDVEQIDISQLACN